MPQGIGKDRGAVAEEGLRKATLSSCELLGLFLAMHLCLCHQQTYCFEGRTKSRTLLRSKADQKP